VENWSTSAAAGEPGDAKSASICLDRMKERLDYEIGSFDERSRRERGYIYASAEIVLDEDKEDVLDEDKDDALEIAFSTYNTMVEEEVILTPYVFVQMIKCCQLVSCQRKSIRQLVPMGLSTSMF
jgi:hypothetical protein